MTEKKLKSQLDLLWKAFMEDVHDDELQIRYDNFMRHYEHLKGMYNKFVTDFNAKVEELSSTKDLLFQTLLMGYPTTNLVDSFKEKEKEVLDMREEIEKVLADMNKEKALADSYKQASDHRLFVWYKALKASKHPEVKNYPEFKAKWGDKII
jgi:hypothetical protein